MSDGRSSNTRLDSVDMLRGLVMVIMALDHTRDFFTDYHEDVVDTTKTSAALFLTRWITHYCAPTFVFLAGTGAYLAGARGRSKPELSWFLLTRGLWLAIFEITYVKWAWTFSYDWHSIGAGVFWPIGWSMVILSALVYLPTSAVAAIGLLIVGYHNMLDGRTADQMHLFDWLWVNLHSGGQCLIWTNPVTPAHLASSIGSLASPLGQGPLLAASSLLADRVEITFGTGYCILPWFGVMASGYGFGALYRLEPTLRRKQLIALGVVITLAFVALRYGNSYGDALHWKPQQRESFQIEAKPPVNADAADAESMNFTSRVFTVFSFLNCTKYPPSLMYLLMTLGPAIFILGVFDRPLGSWARPFIVFGRVPMFYYLLHLPLIHAAAVGLDYYRYGSSPLLPGDPWGPPEKWPTDYGLSLPYVYLAWIAVVVFLYPFCYLYAKIKRRWPGGILSYL